jgi:hypothetical protein
MVRPDENHPKLSTLNYARPSLQLESRWRKVVARTAILNMVFVLASVLCSSFLGNAWDQIAVPAWVVCSALFGISYCILLIQVLGLTLGRHVRVQVWVSVWTIVIGLIAVGVFIGFLYFMAVL